MWPSRDDQGGRTHRIRRPGRHLCDLSPRRESGTTCGCTATSSSPRAARSRSSRGSSPAHLIDDPHPPSDSCTKGPTIRKFAVLGARSTISPGVEVGEGAVVGAASLVRETSRAYSGRRGAGNDRRADVRRPVPPWPARAGVSVVAPFPPRLPGGRASGSRFEPDAPTSSSAPTKLSGAVTRTVPTTTAIAAQRTLLEERDHPDADEIGAEIPERQHDAPPRARASSRTRSRGVTTTTNARPAEIDERERDRWRKHEREGVEGARRAQRVRAADDEEAQDLPRVGRGATERLRAASPNRSWVIGIAPGRPLLFS